jgi:TonB family protein
MQLELQFEAGPFLHAKRELRAPRFLVELPPWRRVFLENLADLLAPRRLPPLKLTSAPAPFWPDVFVEHRLRPAAFGRSAVCHLVAFFALWGVGRLLPGRPQVEMVSPLENAKVVYYPVPEYLPPIVDRSASPPAKHAKRARPARAPQRIISRPRHADNFDQSIINAAAPVIPYELRLPNLVAWNHVAGPPPKAVAVPMGSRLTAPPPPAPVPPPPAISHARFRAPELAAAPAVPPSPAISRTALKPPLPAPADAIPPPPAVLRDRQRAAALTLPTVAPPPPELNGASTRARPLPSPSPVEPPPDVAQLHRSGAALDPLDSRGALPSASAVEPPPIRIASNRPRDSDMTVSAPAVATNIDAKLRELAVLGLHPVVPAGPVAIPEANRRGRFAAGPEGKPSAPGTPEVHGGGKPQGPGGNNARSTGKGESPLDGVTVAPAPEAARLRTGASPAASGALPLSAGGGAQPFVAALGPARAADIARLTKPHSGPPVPEPEIHDAVFGFRKSYSMTLNMPNLASTSGSWIIRFAERKEEGPGTLSAPVPTLKIDPAYPQGLRWEHTEGVVELYAIIYADGTVGEVRVLHGVDSRLDASARDALQRWRFQPASKDGRAVEVEAVVQIPFRAAE